MREYGYGNGRLLTRTSAHKEVDLIGYSWNKELGKDYFSLDSLGSATMRTGNNGETTDLYDYDVYGSALTGDLSSDNRFGYNGKAIDPVTGFYDYGFRDYSPLQMRFTTVDPIRDSLNWYGYVGNDPINKIDPNGLWTFSIGLGVSGGVLGVGQLSTAIDFSYSEESGFQVGVQISAGGGAHGPASGSVTADVSVSANDELSDLDGRSVHK